MSDIQIQKYKYRNTVKVTVADRPYMYYIFEKVMVRGPQKQCSQVSDVQIHKYKYTNTQIQPRSKLEIGPFLVYFSKQHYFELCSLCPLVFINFTPFFSLFHWSFHRLFSSIFFINLFINLFTDFFTFFHRIFLTNIPPILHRFHRFISTDLLLIFFSNYSLIFFHRFSPLFCHHFFTHIFTDFFRFFHQILTEFFTDFVTFFSGRFIHR